MPSTDNANERRLAVTLESRVESANIAEEMIDRLAEREFGEKDRHDIALAVREAMANAVLHGNRFDGGKKIYLNVQLSPDDLRISIRDEGDGCEPESVPDPLHSDNLMRESGRGMLLIRACMDEVTWRRVPTGGTDIIMTKYLSQSGPEPK